MRYNRLPLPKDSAWDRKSLWKKYCPVWIKQFISSVGNLIKWFNIIYKDRNYSHEYIYDILQHKLLLQRNYLVHHNRHLGVDVLNRDITICLNLIELLRSDYYGLEYMDYVNSDLTFNKIGGKELYEMNMRYKRDNLDIYFNKYKGIYDIAILKYKDRYGKEFNNSLTESRVSLALIISMLMGEKCKKLLFKIICDKIEHWWD